MQPKPFDRLSGVSFSAGCPQNERMPFGFLISTPRNDIIAGNSCTVNCPVYVDKNSLKFMP